MTIQAKKSLGQNFLKNDGVLQKIADAGNISINDIILEIGPGEGALTKKLLEKAGKVIAVEKDDRLIEILKEKFSKEISENRFVLIHGDILELEIGKTGDKQSSLGLTAHKYKLLANIPYYITGLIFRKFLESDCQPETAVLLVQKEVADRVMARDGKESLLSLSVKAYGKPSFVAKVSKGSFVPAPTVDSAILLIENISKEFFASFQGSASKLEKDFFEILKAGFAHKRKILISNLKDYFEKNGNGKILSETFTDINLPQKIRAEDLKLEDWKKLLTEVKK